MPLPLRRIEERLGQLAGKSPVASHAYGRALKEAGRGWRPVGHGQRSTTRTLEELVSLTLPMLLGPPADAVANLETYGSLRIETHSVFAGDAPVGQPTICYGRLDRPIEVAGVPVAASLLKTMALYAEAFAGPARDQLDRTPVTLRIVKDGDFPYAVAEVIDGPRPQAARSWLRTPNLALRDTPLALVQTVQGLAQAVQYVDARRARV